MKLIDFTINPKQAGESFERIADELMNNWFLQVHNNRFRICELEFYYHGPGHEDPYTHKHPNQKSTGNWYLHPSGLDIAIGSNNAYGGILIRAIKNEDSNNETYTYGPLNSLTEMFSKLATVYSAELLFGLQRDAQNSLEKERVIMAPRVGLNPSKDKEYAKKLYRFLIFPKKKHAEKVRIAESMKEQEYNKEEIDNIWGVMVSDFETNTIYFSELLRTDARYKNNAKQIFSILDAYGLNYKFLPDTKDIWARDYMPIQVNDTKFVEFRYDPDYLHGDSDDEKTRELKTYPDIVCDAIGLKTYKTDIILDGGNVVKSKNSIILTDKVVWENRRTYSEKRLISKLHDLFEVEKVVLIPWDEDCEFGHADGMLRFIDEDRVLISGFYETADIEFKEQIIRELKKEEQKWEFLRCSDKEVEDNIAYINFLLTEDILLIPKLNRKEDEVAFEQLSKFYPGYAARNRIAQADVSGIFKFSGALNCITWTVKK